MCKKNKQHFKNNYTKVYGKGMNPFFYQLRVNGKKNCLSKATDSGERKNEFKTRELGLTTLPHNSLPLKLQHHRRCGKAVALYFQGCGVFVLYYINYRIKQNNVLLGKEFCSENWWHILYSSVISSFKKCGWSYPNV